MKPKAQVRRLPVKVSGPKMGVPSYKGQDTGKPARTSAAEARANLDAKPNLAFVPTIDDPSRKVSVTVIPSNAIEQKLGK